MANISLQKTIQTDPIANTTLTAGGSLTSGVIDVSQAWSGRLYWDLAHLNNPASSSPTPPQINLEVSQQASGDDTWVLYKQRMPMQLSDTSGTVASFVFTNDLFFNATDIWSTAGLSGARWIFFQDNDTAKWEWANQIAAVAPAPTIYIRDPLLYNHDSVTCVLRRAARYTYEFDVSSVKRLRVTLNNNVVRTGAVTDFAVHVGMTITEAVT